MRVSVNPEIEDRRRRETCCRQHRGPRARHHSQRSLQRRGGVEDDRGEGREQADEHGSALPSREQMKRRHRDDAAGRRPEQIRSVKAPHHGCMDSKGESKAEPGKKERQGGDGDRSNPTNIAAGPSTGHVRSCVPSTAASRTMALYRWSTVRLSIVPAPNVNAIATTVAIEKSAAQVERVVRGSRLPFRSCSTAIIRPALRPANAIEMLKNTKFGPTCPPHTDGAAGFPGRAPTQKQETRRAASTAACGATSDVHTMYHRGRGRSACRGIEGAIPVTGKVHRQEAFSAAKT